MAKAHHGEHRQSYAEAQAHQRAAEHLASDAELAREAQPPRMPPAEVAQPVTWDRRDAEVIEFARAVQADGTHALQVRAASLLRKLGVA